MHYLLTHFTVTHHFLNFSVFVGKVLSEKLKGFQRIYKVKVIEVIKVNILLFIVIFSKHVLNLLIMT